MRGKPHIGALSATPAGDRGGIRLSEVAPVSASGSDTPDTWRGILRLLRRRQPHKTAFLIADWTGHSLRTVRRWMAGDTVPGVDVAFDLIRTDHGPAIIELIARSLPPKERAAFFRDLMKVAQRAELQARLEDLGDGDD